MTLLAPLYIAGALAIALPIVFHLIRRAPQGRQDFSSLMFLTASPPRLTRRSRLNNIVLLLLRAAALALLAFAFARPFLRRDAEVDVDRAQGRRVAIMLDTSASMRRGDLWQQAVAQAEQVAAGLTPADEAALYLFDRTARPAMTFAEWGGLDHPRRLAMLRARLKEAGPTWQATRLGDALGSVADALAEGEAPRDGARATKRQLVLVSDMQEGAHIDALQGHQWPEAVVLDVKPVALKRVANAGLHLVNDADAADADAAKLRVRVANQPDSTREQFTLSWSNDRGALPGLDPVKVYVPPGRSQIVKVPWPPPGRVADRLVLGGDDADFDNVLYVVPPRKEQLRVVYLGDDAADDTRGLRYYLESALVETPRRKTDVVARKAADALASPDLLDARLVVVAGAQAPERAAMLRRFAETGGGVLWVLKDAAAGRGLEVLLGSPVPVEEAPKRDFALLGHVDTGHPLFAPFGEARFADFTKIHFWAHRRLDAKSAPNLRTLAAFDNGDAFLLEAPVGKGRVLLATSGWHPADSQLALSTKFVPLIDRLVRPGDGADGRAQYAVHDPVALPSAAGDAKRTLRGPDGRQVEVPAASRTFDAADEPGIYHVTVADREYPVAVNLAADESRTAPVAVEELEQWGARLGTQVPPEAVAARQRQLQTAELENRQKLWRWGVLAVLGLLFAETALAGGLARRAARETQAEQVSP